MVTDLRPFQNSIVRIATLDRCFVGVGYLIERDIVLTCAHVISRALGKQAPIGMVKLSRPIAVALGAEPKSIGAHVKDGGWFPPRSEDEAIPDLAVLVADEPLLRESEALAHLTPSLEHAGVNFMAYGGPKGYEDTLVDIEGSIGNIIGNGLYRLSASPHTYTFEPGCSGGPIWDKDTGCVIGLISQADLTIRAGFMIPTEQLREALRVAAPSVYYGPAASPLAELRKWIRERLAAYDFGLADSVSRFVENYEGSAANPVPFAGRAPELVRLDHRLEDAEKRVCLLTSSAGRGKSALLLRWLASVRKRHKELSIVFLPISIRFETNDELRGLRLLHGWLSGLFPDLRFPPGTKPELTDYRHRIADAWQRMGNRPEKSFLVVVDGVDEADQQWILNSVLPREVPSNLRIVISARHKRGEQGRDTWLQDFSFNPSVSTELLPELQLLTKKTVKEAVAQLGHPLDELAEGEALVDQLYRLTDHGDPLLVTLWVRQLWAKKDRNVQLLARDLEKMQPSFQGFLDLWCREQSDIWRQRQIDVDIRDFGWILDVLAFTKGPLRLDELCAIVERLDVTDDWSKRQTRRVMETATRLIVGDGEQQGYTFVHPRLNEHFENRIHKNKARLTMLRKAYLAWGATTVQRLSMGDLEPVLSPRYLVRHYLNHVADAGLPQDRALQEYYLPLLEAGWHRCWIELEGVYDGFLKDLSQIEDALHEYDRQLGEHPGNQELLIGEELFCHLVRVSIRATIENIPPSLIVGLVKAGLWTPNRALRVAHQSAYSNLYVKCLRGLLRLTLPLVDQDSQTEIIEYALAAVEEIFDSKEKAELMVALAERLEGKPILLARALETIEKFEVEWFRSTALVAVAKQLVGEPALLEQALAVAEKIKDPHYRAKALFALDEQLDSETRQKALEQALVGVPWIVDKVPHDKLLLAQAEQLEDETRRATLEQALAAAEEIPDAQDRAKALIALAEQLEGETRRAVLEQALAATTRIGDEVPLAKTLLALAKQLDGETRKAVLEQALAAATRIDDKVPCAKLLLALAEQLEDETRQAALKQALSVAEKIADAQDRAETIAALAEQLDDESRLAVLKQALSVAEEIADAQDRAETIVALAEQLEGETRQEALEQARAVLEQALESAMTPDLSKPYKPHKHYNMARHVKVLVVLAKQLEDETRQAVLKQALSVAEEIADARDRAETIVVLAEQLGGEARMAVLAQALSVAGEIPAATDRAEALIALAGQLEGETRRTVLEQALTAAESCLSTENGRKSWAFAEGQPDYSYDLKSLGAFVRVAEQLEGEPALLERALVAAERIVIDWARAKALAEVGRHSEGEVRRAAVEGALTAIKRIENPRQRTEVSIVLAAEKLKGETCYRNFRDWVEIVGLTNRALMLEQITLMLPTIRNLGGDTALERVAHATAKTAKWWP